MLMNKCFHSETNMTPSSLPYFDIDYHTGLIVSLFSIYRHSGLMENSGVYVKVGYHVIFVIF